VISRYVYEISGIALDETKAYLMETRLTGLLSESGCASYSELYYKAKADRTRSLEKKIIDAITTSETTFFRDQSPFELLQYKILPDLIDRKTVGVPKSAPLSIRIWSAACSTGQEVYSVAILLKELLKDSNRFNIRMLATDISDAAIARASYAVYNKFEIERGLPKDRLQKYFEVVGDSWKVKDEIRSMATFKRQNLMESLHGLGKFDIILCRNVAIYFTMEDRVKLFDRIANNLEPDGCLVIGASEFLTGVCSRFESKRYLRSVFYQLKG